MKASPEDIAKLEKLALERGGTVSGCSIEPGRTSPGNGPLDRDRALSGPAARGRPRHTQGRMTKLEEKHSLRLNHRIVLGEVAAYWFEAVKLRLADNTFYTPDFLVLLTTGFLEFHEVKGHWEDDARVKWKIAAETFPCFAFVAFTKDGEERYR